MTKFKVISIDMFRTLADVESTKHLQWQMILKDKYSVELAEECHAYLRNSWDRHFPQDTFLSMKSILMSAFTGLLSSIDIEFDPTEATKLCLQRHSFSKPFDDSMLFLNSVGKEYPICLASDTDDDMLGTLEQMYAFDYIFTSEQLGSYKANADGKFFSAIINHYGVRPEEIIHIGDSDLEIIGADKAGIITCWLNRTSSKWSHDVKPDYEVNLLIAVASILGIDIDSE
ncbi:HAD family hydrolase [Chloroflexota bacterium]